MAKNTILTAALVVLFFFQKSLWADISHRKADLTVQVKTPNSVPIEGATVEIEMLNHAFRFGTSVEYHLINPEASTYDATPTPTKTGERISTNTYLAPIH